MNTPDHRRRFDLLWTARETSTILILCVLAAAAMIVSSALSQFDWIQSLPPPNEQAQARIREKIDPNTASVGSLRRLHGIGPAYAQAIVDYRSGGKTFRTRADLEHVRGLGPTRVARIISELALPGEPAAGSQEPPTDESD
ncbi:MAG: helix-hairpin-helix domain-containing protein [Planctomycetaceae bacterium]|nr:helix-hairpin-helix domain-containing protein [Planctomycetaceae bacterium]